MITNAVDILKRRFGSTVDRETAKDLYAEGIEVGLQLSKQAQVVWQGSNTGVDWYDVNHPDETTYRYWRKLWLVDCGEQQKPV